MSNSEIVVAVCGFERLATELKRADRFRHVVHLASTSELKEALGKGLSKAPPHNLVFLFAADLPVDTKISLDQLISRIATRGYMVAVLDTAPDTDSLITTNGADAPGVIRGAMSVNNILGSISGMHSIKEVILPVDDPSAFEDLRTTAASAVAASTVTTHESGASTGWATPASTAPSPTAQNPPKPEADPEPTPGAASAWNTTTPDAAPTPTSAPAGDAGGWQTSEPAVQAQAEGWTTSEPAPQPAPQPVDSGGSLDTASGWSTVAPDDTQTGQETASPRTEHNDSPTSSAFAPAPATGGGGLSGLGGPAPAPATGGGGLSGLGGPVAQAAPTSGDGWSKPVGTTPTTEAPSGLVSREETYSSQEHIGMVIPITAPKGGTGKSTLSLNLAAYCGLRLQGTGKRVLLVDANTQQGDTAKYLNLFGESTIYDLHREPGPLRPATVSKYLVQRPDLNLHILCAPATPAQAMPLSIDGALYASVLNVARDMFDYIFVDTPVAELHHNVFDEMVLPEADRIIVAATPNHTTVINIAQWLRTIGADTHAGGRGFDTKRVGIVLNRAESDIGCSEEDVRKELAEYRYLGSIPESKQWKRANNTNQLIAQQNIVDLNHAFASILWQVTNDPDLQPQGTGNAPTAKASGGLFSRLLGRDKG